MGEPLRKDSVQGYSTIKYEGTSYFGNQGGDQDFIRCYKNVNGVTALDIHRLWVIYLLEKQCRQLEGDFFECGVHTGGSAKFIAQVMAGAGKKLHLFDTFCGMPQTDPSKDWHLTGDFADTSLKQVRSFVGYEDEVVFHAGFMPDTFAGLEDSKIAFAHIDVDIYRSMRDCCEFVYPRMVPGGVMVLDDYGQPTCDGARLAVDEYFAGKRSIPISIRYVQAIVFKI